MIKPRARYSGPGRDRGNMKKYDEAKKMFEREITEKDIVAEIIARLGFAKIPVFIVRENLPTGYRMSDPGIPDLHGRVPKGYVRKGIQVEFMSYSVAQPVYVEVKRPGEMAKYHAGGYRSKPKRESTFQRQEYFINQARADGCIACFAESWNDVCDEFEQHGIILTR